MDIEDFNLENVAPPDPKTVIYEFTNAQNATIQLLAQRMKFIGLMYIACAAITVFAGIDSLLSASLMSIGFFSMVAFFGFVGWWTYEGSTFMEAIIRSKGNDVMQLMAVFDNLRKTYEGTFRLLVGVLSLWLLGILVSVILLA
ncbi:MAG TPA: hypothetical protein VMM58_08955 [Bacteroidota bacterium]|nr:hypothetical protein [Bacteroidota bacterium]